MALVALDPIEHYGIQSPETEFYIGDIRLTQLYSQCRHFRSQYRKLFSVLFSSRQDQQPFVQIIQIGNQMERIVPNVRSTPFPPAATD